MAETGVLGGLDGGTDRLAVVTNRYLPPALPVRTIGLRYRGLLGNRLPQGELKELCQEPLPLGCISKDGEQVENLIDVAFGE